MNRLDLKKKVPTLCLTAISIFALTGNAYAIDPIETLPVITSVNGATYSNPDLNTLKIDVIQNVADVKCSQFNVGQDKQVLINFTADNQSLFARVTSVGSRYSSQIDGKITQMGHNGNFYLINPNGILISKDAKINVGSFMASTLNLSDSDLNSFSATKSLVLARLGSARPGGIFIEQGANINVNNGIMVANGITDKNIPTATNVNFVTSDGVTFKVNSNNFVDKTPVALTPYTGTATVAALRSYFIPITNSTLPTPDPIVVPTYDTTHLPIPQDMELIAPTPLKLVAQVENHNHTGTNIAVFPIGQTSLTGSMNGDQTPGLIALNNTNQPALTPGMEIALTELTPVGAAGRIQNVGNAPKENVDMVIDQAILPE
jgi:filamentous hemagglutinin family protein